MFEHEKQAAQQALKAFRSARLLPSLGGRQRKPPSLLPIAAALAVRRGEFDLVNNRPIPIVERPLAAAKAYGIKETQRVRMYIEFLNRDAPERGPYALVEPRSTGRRGVQCA